MSQPEDERSQTPKALKMFGRELGVGLPLRLTQLRRLGKQSKALGGRRPKAKG